MAKDGRVNIRLDTKLVKQVKAYAKRNHTTVSALIIEHLRELIVQDRELQAISTTGEVEQI